MGLQMANLRLILGDQLSPEISSLKGITADDVVLMAELKTEAGYANHHKKRSPLFFPPCGILLKT